MFTTTTTHADSKVAVVITGKLEGLIYVNDHYS